MGDHKCRKIDFRQNEKDIYTRIVTVEYDIIEMHTFVSYIIEIVKKYIFYFLEVYNL